MTDMNSKEYIEASMNAYRIAWAESLRIMANNIKSLAFLIDVYGVFAEGEKSKLDKLVEEVNETARRLKADAGLKV